MLTRVVRGSTKQRFLKGGVALSALMGIAVTPILAGLGATPAGAAATQYTPAGPTLDTITSPAGCSGSACAPWNEYQGDSAFPAYSSQAPGQVLPVYEDGGATTSTNNGVSGATVTAPNLSVVPSASSGTDGVAGYPSGVVGTPGPLDDYCGSGNTTEAGQPVSRQPGGSTLPLAPAYFPHIVRNADGSLTGYFDYRPKDADEALVAATSTDNGQDWTYAGEALEQNPGYCPSADINDDGQGHANLIEIGGQWYLYTLARAAGDMQGVGMVVHQFTPSEANPLAGLPASESVGIDPDAFVTGSSQISVPTSGTGVSLPLTTTGTAGSPEQLLTGGFVDLTQDPSPTIADQLLCTVTLGSPTITGCTAPKASAALTVNPGDLIEQILGWTTPSSDVGLVIPAGPNTTNGDAGQASITIDNSAAGGTPLFTNPLTGSTFNNNAPNRLYIDGTAMYCAQSNTNPTTHIENCTTGPKGSSLTISSPLEILTGDPIVPATAYNTAAGDGMTNGLVAPDGIVGVLPSYPGAPAGSTVVMYTEKELSYYIAAQTTAKATLSSTTAFSLASTPGPYIGQDLPATGPWTVSIGATAPSPSTATAIVTLTCTGLNKSTGAFTGCLAPAAETGWSAASNSYVGAPGATTVSATTLALTGEGSASNVAKLYKNNEDLTILRVAYTSDGVNFSTTGLANGGVISGENNCGTTDPSVCTSTGSYDDISNPSTNVSPANLNQYATNEGTPGGANGTDIGSTAGGDIDEMRWVGSAGSIITNPDGSYGLFLSGAWAADGDSDAYNQIFYATSTDGENWSVPTPVISTDYTFSASYNQDSTTHTPIGISAYYEGRAYGPSVVQNANGTLTMVFAGYRFPKSISSAGTVLGTGSPQWTVGPNDLTMYRNILTTTLQSSTTPAVATQTTASSSPAAPVVGQQVTLSATVSVPSPGTGSPTGTVSFSDANGPICTGTLSDTAPDTASCTTSYASAQADDVTAAYQGDSNYATSSGMTTVTVVQAATTTTVASSANPSVVGQPITLTGTVSVNAPNIGTPSGTVTFTGGAGTLCTGTLNGSSPDVATCQTTYQAPTSDTLTAAYGGDAAFGASTSSALTQVVQQDGTNTTLGFTPSSPVSGQSVTFTATVAPQGPGAGAPSGTITIEDAGGTLCTATLGPVAMLIQGSCSAIYPGVTSDAVTAVYGGDTNFTGSSGTTMVTVGQASTSTTLTTSPSAPVVGQPVSFTTTVAPTAPGAGTPTGTVTVADAGGTLCTGTLNGSSPDQATCSSTYASPTTDAVTASYGGDTNFGGSSQGGSVSIGLDATTTTLATLPDPSVSGQAVTLTATVAINGPGAGVPGGTVTFTGNAGTLCTASLNGSSPDQATCSTTYAGTTVDTITAAYGGDTNDSGSTSTTVTQTVDPAATNTTLAFTPATPVTGQAVTFTATVAAMAPGAGAPTGSVTVSDAGGTLCTGTLNGADPDTASCSATYGAATSDNVTASYGGDANFSASSGMTTVAVGKAATSTGLVISPSAAVVGQAITLTATVSPIGPGAGTPTGTVSFSDGAPLCQAVLSAAHPDVATCATNFTGTASVTVTASYGGDANFAGSSQSAALTVSPGGTTTAVVSSANPAVNGQVVTYTATVHPVAPSTGTPTGSVTFTLSGPAHVTEPTCQGGAKVSLSAGSASCTLSSGLTIAQGPVTVTATYSGSDAFVTSAGSLHQTVAKDAASVSISAAANPTQTSAAASFTAVVSAVAPGSGHPTGTATWTITSATGATLRCSGGNTAVSKTTGQTTCTVNPDKLFAASGPYTVSVSYSGDGNFLAASGTYLQNISKAGSKVTLGVVGPAGSGKSATITATVAAVPGNAGAPTGSVSFSVSGSNGAVSCSGGDTVALSGSTAKCVIPSALVSSGSPYTAVATYSGDGNIDGSTSAPKTITVH